MRKQDFPFHLADFVQRARVHVLRLHLQLLISHQINCAAPYEWAKLHSVMFTWCAFMPYRSRQNLAKSADKSAPGAKSRNKNVIYLRLPRHKNVSGLADSNGTLKHLFHNKSVIISSLASSPERRRCAARCGRCFRGGGGGIRGIFY